MSTKPLSVTDLSICFLLIEDDYRGVNQQLKDLKLRDFDTELKSRCSEVFLNQLLECKKIIDESGIKTKLEGIKENLKSCTVKNDQPTYEGQLDLIGDRVADVNAIVRRKIDELGQKIGKFDRNLTRLCSLIDSHIGNHEINACLVGMLANDLACMDKKELDQMANRLNRLEQNQKKWLEPRNEYLRKHLSTHHKDEKAEFKDGLSDIKSKLQREQFLRNVVFVLDELKAACQKPGNRLDLEQRFSTLPPELQWQIFKSAGLVAGALPVSSIALVDCINASQMNMPQQLTNMVNTGNEELRSLLLKNAVVLFLSPEKAFIACMDALKGYSDSNIENGVIAAVIAQYSSDVVSIETESSEPFGLLKELIKLNRKSDAKEESINRLLAEAEQKGLDLQGPRGVYFWVWFFAHQQDPKAGGPNFGLENAHKDLDRLVLAIDEAIVTPEQLLQRYASANICSIGQLQAEIEKIKEHPLNAGQKEGVVYAILSAALRGGIALDKPNGIYHWVWAIARQTDSWAHGDNWGCNNAHKNIERLLKAIDKSA